MGDPDEPFLGITRGDRLVVGVLVVTSLVLMAAHWAQLSGWGTRPIEIDRIPRRPVDFQLDLNTVNWVELSQLEGIGPKLARRIITESADGQDISALAQMAFRIVLARMASDEETGWCVETFAKHKAAYITAGQDEPTAHHSAMTRICQMLFSTSEFIYID